MINYVEQKKVLKTVFIILSQICGKMALIVHKTNYKIHHTSNIQLYMMCTVQCALYIEGSVPYRRHQNIFGLQQTTDGL